jgi:lysine-N-methylase
VPIAANLPENLPPEYAIRQSMMDILKNDSFLLENRLFLIFHMLLTLYSEENATVDKISSILKEHENLSFLTEIIENEKALIPSLDEKPEELKELFLDIAMNYRNVENLKIYLQEIYTIAEKLNDSVAAAQWKKFDVLYENFEKLLANYLLAKIFTECCNEDVYEILLSYQMIISEYAMIKFSVFLNWIRNPENGIQYDALRDYMVIYSRIIGYNPEGMFEFWEENFQEAIWELEYFLLLF